MARKRRAAHRSAVSQIKKTKILSRTCNFQEDIIRESLLELKLAILQKLGGGIKRNSSQQLIIQGLVRLTEGEIS